jgi:hypothetical protein
MADQQYLCPSCAEVLNAERQEMIQLRGVLRGPAFEVAIPIGVPSELGVYGVEVDEGVTLNEGCRVELFCPHCEHDLTTSYDSGWAELKMVEGDHEYVVVFNKVYGERSSLLFDFGTRKLVATYGDATEDYVAAFGKNINFFGS